MLALEHNLLADGLTSEGLGRTVLTVPHMACQAEKLLRAVGGLGLESSVPAQDDTPDGDLGES